MMRNQLLNKLRRLSGLHKTKVVCGGFGAMEELEGRTLLSGVELQTPDDAAFYQILTAAAGATPTVTVKATDARATESSAKRPDRGYFTFTRTGATTEPLTVQYLIGGTAKNGLDYQSIGTSITLPAGSASASIAIQAIDDARVEKTESVRLVLAEDAAYAIGAMNDANVGIVDNDAPLVTLTASIANASEVGASVGKFTLQRAGSLTQPLTVYYSLFGKAKNGVDYKRLAGSVTFKAGKRLAAVYVTPIDDLRVEAAETVTLRLVNSYYVVAGTGAATVTIADNDYTANDSPGGITFVGPLGRHGDSFLFWVAAETDPAVTSTPTNLSQALAAFSAGRDYGINVSPNGLWMVLHSDRFGGLSGTGSLVVVPKSNLGAGQQIRVGGNTVVPASGSISAVGNSGNVIIYESTAGPHNRDLWAVKYALGAWTNVLLTNDSTYLYNMHPAISADGTTVLFAAGDTSAAEGDAIAEVNIDGTGYHTIVTGQGQVSHPDYGLNGDMVFGSDQGGDRIWRRNNLGNLSLVSGVTNEFAPAVLPDGRIVSLWSQVADPGPHVYELTLRSALGVRERTILPDASFPIMNLGVGA